MINSGLSTQQVPDLLPDATTSALSMTELYPNSKLRSAWFLTTIQPVIAHASDPDFDRSLLEFRNSHFSVEPLQTDRFVPAKEALQSISRICGEGELSVQSLSVLDSTHLSEVLVSQTILTDAAAHYTGILGCLPQERRNGLAARVILSWKLALADAIGWRSLITQEFRRGRQAFDLPGVILRDIIFMETRSDTLGITGATLLSDEITRWLVIGCQPLSPHNTDSQK